MKARRWRRGALLGLVLTVALVAAGCGDDGADSGSTGTTAGAAPTVDEALAAKVPDTIKSDGKVLIAGGRGFELPDNYYDLDSAEVYDPVTGSWTAIANMRASRT